MNVMDDNELNRVRELLREPPSPSAEVSAKALSRLEDAIASDGGRGRLPRPVSGTRPWRSGWPLRLGVGVVAAGAAAAAVIVATGQGTPGSPPAPSGVDLGKQAVLAAAEKAAAQPTGEYWYSDSVDGQAYIVRAKTGTYAITGASSETFQWTGAERGMGEAYYGRDLPAHPQTPRDQALWREAGSPSKFRVWSNDHYYTYTAKATKWRSDGPGVGIHPDGGGTFFGLGRGAASLEDLQNLPADPAKLAEKFLSRAAIERPIRLKARHPRKTPTAPRLPEGVLARLQIQRTAAMLAGPLPPKVRAGLMRALAAQPGVSAAGRATDPLGRTGVALAAGDRPATTTAEFGAPKAEQGTYHSRKVIIFDERTGALLSVEDRLTKPGGKYKEMKAGFVINHVTTRASGWTNTKPKPPAALPF